MDYLLFSYQYNRLPEITKDSFTDSSWNFYISKGEVKSKSKPPEYDLSGYCSYEEEKIWAEIDIDDFGTVIHEFGHFADCKNNFVSLQTEWKQIWNKEKEKISEYAMKNEIEGLAEAFEQAYLYGAAFKIKCSQSYNFIIRTFGEAQ